MFSLPLLPPSFLYTSARSAVFFLVIDVVDGFSRLGRRRVSLNDAAAQVKVGDDYGNREMVLFRAFPPSDSRLVINQEMNSTNTPW